MTYTLTTILLALTFTALVALATWFVTRQTVEVEPVRVVHHPFTVLAPHPFDWQWECPEWTERLPDGFVVTDGASFGWQPGVVA